MFGLCNKIYPVSIMEEVFLDILLTELFYLVER